MADKAFSTHILAPGDIDRALAFYAATGNPYKPEDETALRKNMGSGDWIFVTAALHGADIAGFYLNFQPKYHVYRRVNIPELQDLRVLPSHRKQGIATHLIGLAESMAQGAGRPGLGISVGLYADYGAAQRLYAQLGYIPDGNGITYDREPVEPGARHPVDDDLALMLLKFF